MCANDMWLSHSPGVFGQWLRWQNLSWQTAQPRGIGGSNAGCHGQWCCPPRGRNGQRALRSGQKWSNAWLEGAARFCRSRTAAAIVQPTELGNLSIWDLHMPISFRKVCNASAHHCRQFHASVASKCSYQVELWNYPGEIPDQIHAMYEMMQIYGLPYCTISRYLQGTTVTCLAHTALLSAAWVLQEP